MISRVTAAGQPSRGYEAALEEPKAEPGPGRTRGGVKVPEGEHVGVCRDGASDTIPWAEPIEVI